MLIGLTLFNVCPQCFHEKVTPRNRQNNDLQVVMIINMICEETYMLIVEAQ